MAYLTKRVMAAGLDLILIMSVTCIVSERQKKNILTKIEIYWNCARDIRDLSKIHIPSSVLLTSVHTKFFPVDIARIIRLSLSNLW